MSFHKDTIRVAAAMSGTTVSASTSVVLVPTSSNYTRPFIVTFPNISTVGRLVTVRDNDGFASTGNTIVLSTTSATAFNGVSGPLTINQPYGFITLTSQANGTYSVLNTFAFPAGQAAANVSNLNAQVVNIQSTLNMYDYGTGLTNTIYTSSSQFIFNGNYIGQVTDEELASTIVNLGTTGYLSSIPVVYVIPPTWIAVGQSSTISQATSTGSLVYSSNGANWFNATGGKGFAKYGTATAFGEAYYIAVGNNDTGAPNTGYNQWSFNARDWYYSYTPDLTVTQMRTACLYANGLFHSVGCNNGVGGASTILWSDDGKSWTPSLGNPFAATNGTGYATGITFGSGNGASGVWVCSGVQNTDSPRYNLLWSSDGSNWNPAATVPFGSLDGVTDVAFDGTRFVALCRGSPYNVCISTDGSNWSFAGITGANFGDQPRYIAGCNGTWVATTGNSGQSLVYSVNGGFTWQSNANLSGSNLPMYKPYYDGLTWWIGVETNDGSQSIYYTNETAPALSNWVNGGQTGGFSNGGFARGFTSTDGQSNVTAILNSTIFGLGVNFTTSNLNASTISASKVFVGELNASTLYIGVTFVSTTYETINNISTQNVDFISAGTLVSTRNFLDSLSVNRVSVGQIIGGPARFTSLSTNTISSGTAFIGQLGVNTGAPTYTLDVNGPTQVSWLGRNLRIGTSSTLEGFALNWNQIRVDNTNGQTEIISGKGGSGTGGIDFFTGVANNTNATASDLAVRITGNKRMGINTSTPQYTLDVNGTMRVQGTSELYNDVKIYNTAGTLNAANGYIRMTTQDGNSYIQSGSNSTNTSNKLYFTSIGETTSKVTVDMVNSRMGININSPAETLDVNGSVWARSTLYVGSDSSTNQIRFYGTVGDGEGTFSHTVIAEYLYGGVEQSELILFKGNNSATTSGPDRVRVLASGGFQVDSGFGLDWQQDSAPPTATYQNALFVSGANGNVGINTNLPRQTLDVNGVLNLQAGTVQGYTFVDSANKTNTYAVFAEAGSGSDWAFLRNIGTLDNYHMALDLHDDDSVNFSIRKVRSSAITDTIQTMFTIDGANSRAGIMTSTPQYTLDVEGDLRVTGSIIGSAASVFTAGMIMIWATATAPTGWFVCNGDAVSRTTYSVLFAIIGSTYGNGDGVNTFNLPDLRSRFPLGTSGTYGLGTTGGSMTQTLTSNQMPAHSHGITDLGHAHESKFPASQGVSSGTSDNAADELLGRAYDTPTTSTLTGITINSAGGGQAFNIINSYQAVNYIIKY